MKKVVVSLYMTETIKKKLKEEAKLCKRSATGHALFLIESCLLNKKGK